MSITQTSQPVPDPKFHRRNPEEIAVSHPGLDRNALRIYDIPYAELAPRLQRGVRKATLRECGEELLAALRKSAQEHLDMAALLDAWARESVEGSWSTHQVDAQRRRADQCRKYAASALAAIAKAEGRSL